MIVKTNLGVLILVDSASYSYFILKTLLVNHTEDSVGELKKALIFNHRIR